MFKDNYNYAYTTNKDLSIQAVDAKHLDKKEFLEQLLEENPKLNNIIALSENKTIVNESIKNWIQSGLKSKPKAYAYYQHKTRGSHELTSLDWEDLASIRILDYIDYSGNSYEDLFLHGEKVTTKPFELIWEDFHNINTNTNSDFYIDMIALFRQNNGRLLRDIPTFSTISNWMKRYPSGLDSEILSIHEKNKIHILEKIIEKLDNGEFKSAAFKFEEGLSQEKKLQVALKWWDTSKFHLIFAFRTPEIINEMTDHTLDEETIKNMNNAKKAGIPFFINPYYLSLLITSKENTSNHIDATLRDYMFYSKELVEEFGHIKAWEKEDVIEPGKPNAAGWLLPTKHNLHRRYPEVAILIPDTIGRACGGLCVSCQRMYDFQSGNLNFNLEKLKPKEDSWAVKLKKLMDYFENDTQLRDILITGGDALMNTDSSLKKILDAVYNMAIRKKEANKKRPDGEKYAEMLRVRLGTRLPVYIPQRITPELISILKEFKNKASKIGIKQFVIQTHFESPLEVTPIVKESIKKLLSAGWIVTNQIVFTTSCARRGHTAKIRKILNDIGVLSYYTFSVKGYLENKHNFATNARAIQEQIEEKNIGKIPVSKRNKIIEMASDAENMIENINSLRTELKTPYLATDRNVLNLPGVGKSLTFRVIGITSEGRRILEFSHDATRWHSPIIHKMGKVIIIESKSMGELLRQLNEIGEDTHQYISTYGYSAGSTEERMSIYEYPEYDYNVTEKMTNIKI